MRRRTGWTGADPVGCSISAYGDAAVRRGRRCARTAGPGGGLGRALLMAWSSAACAGRGLQERPRQCGECRGSQPLRVTQSCGVPVSGQRRHIWLGPCGKRSVWHEKQGSDITVVVPWSAEETVQV